MLGIETPEPVPDSRNAVSPHFFHDPRRADGLSPRWSAQAQISNGNTYTIGGIEEDVTGADAVQARQTAIREARQKAVKLLVERMVSPEDRAKVPQVRRAAARQHGARRRVPRERTAGNRYSATLAWCSAPSR